MWLLLIIILFIIIGIFLSIIENSNPNIQQIKNKEKSQINFSNFITTNYVMTKTELIFYRKLKKLTDTYEMTIFPQVDLERFIKVKDNNSTDRNRIKSRSVDFTLVRNEDCKILLCIELDDNSHNTKKAKESDKFKDQIFKQVGIPLYRIHVSNYYKLNEIENILKITCSRN